ncbi:MAG: hypothetical protein LKH78_10660 [Weizmannia coagulans]|jgi:hypothetical protein|uniref:hypothetical protein n=1 Tax=Heyndrickxia TaxID=2837504 RepID=UPI00068B9014|nr:MULTISPECIES: hypothetical protein [Heyndrickxia]AVD55708.1 hypothetical protein C3766_06010 [Heyndrickxia coagulans]AWP36596.1 hypothetical protein CYJ15_06215 [Heyndrickxia coagulans]MBQ4911094.1 hypothetical protein [Heyndrickxia faecalis]MCI1576162.1 hypothetical protein [Heyndrickxia coagulans]MEC2224253.1 hypothetical protein [Weizmannia sp. CD-2023]
MSSENNVNLKNPPMSRATADELLPVLDAIEHIPDELLEQGNQDEIQKYFKDTLPKIQTKSVWSCSLAIGELLVTNAIPIAKLTKIKKYVKALGGAWETAKLLVGATTAGEKIAALSALMAELTGFTNVRNECGF